MSDGVVKIAPDSTGKSVDTSELTVSGNTVERQRMVAADPTLAAALGRVGLSGSLQTASPATEHLLSLLLVELKVISAVLAHSSGLDAEAMRQGFLIEG